MYSHKTQDEHTMEPGSHQPSTIHLSMTSMSFPQPILWQFLLFIVWPVQCCMMEFLSAHSHHCYDLNPLYLFPHLPHYDSFLTTVYFISHLLCYDLYSDSHFSQPCTLSHTCSTMTHNSPYLRNVYIDLGIHCNNPT